MSERLSKKQLIAQILFTPVINTLIALVLTASGGDFYINMVFSQCIGMSIFTLVILGVQSNLFTTRPRKLAMATLAIIIGAVFGTYLAVMLLGLESEVLFAHIAEVMYGPVAFGLFFGTIITYFFYTRAHAHKLDSLAKGEQIRRLASEKELTLAQIKLVQAQIEPHFLFNTLANIGSLIERDTTKAKQMLEDLNRYLRTVLDRTRKGSTTLAEETKLLQAYLSIIGLRMGERLSYRIDIPPELLDISFPPLLIQPLVENAIRHGLEKKLDGGRVEIRAREEGGQLTVEVEDNGIGLAREWHPGVGLDNVYQRLQGLYGRQAELQVKGNEAGGVSAMIRLPLTVPGEGR
jgi:signal transduction histidine kinase